MGSGGRASAGASSPFLVVAAPLGADERLPIENRPFALGADATRRMKRLADAPTPRGESGAARGGEGCAVLNDCCERKDVCGSADCGGLLRPRPSVRCLSVFVRARCGSGSGAGSAIGGSVGCEDDHESALGACGGGRGDVPELESVDCVLDELKDERRSADAKEVGVGEACILPGVRLPGVPSPFMSRVSDEPIEFALLSFRDEPFPMRRIDFHEGEPRLGEAGEARGLLV